MRVYQRGSVIRVTLSRQEVAAFNRSWPCSNLPNRRVWFDFWSNGDLLDYGPWNNDGRYDGAALLALSHDAQAYAVRRHCLASYVSTR